MTLYEYILEEYIALGSEECRNIEHQASLKYNEISEIEKSRTLTVNEYYQRQTAAQIIEDIQAAMALEYERNHSADY